MVTAWGMRSTIAAETKINVCKSNLLLTLVKVLEILVLVVAGVPSVALTVLACFDDENTLSSVVVIVVCISLHGRWWVSFVI